MDVYDNATNEKKSDRNRMSISDPDYEISADKIKELRVIQQADEGFINPTYVEILKEPGTQPKELSPGQRDLRHIYLNTPDDNPQPCLVTTAGHERPHEGAVKNEATDIEESYLTVPNTRPEDKYLTVLKDTRGGSPEDKYLTVIKDTPGGSPEDKYLTVLKDTPGGSLEYKYLTVLTDKPDRSLVQADEQVGSPEDKYLMVISTPDANSHQPSDGRKVTKVTDNPYTYADGLGAPNLFKTAHVKPPPLPPEPMPISPVEKELQPRRASDAVLVRYVSHEPPYLPQRDLPTTQRNSEGKGKYDTIDDEYQSINDLKWSGNTARVRLPLPLIPVKKSSLVPLDRIMCNRRRAWVAAVIVLVVCVVVVVVVVPSVVVTRKKHSKSGIAAAVTITTTATATTATTTTTASATTTSGVPCNKTWQLYWSDEFSGSFIDTSKWRLESTAWGGGISAFQVFTPSPDTSFVKDGKLYIYPQLLENITNPITGQPYGENFIYDGTLDLNYLYGSCTQSLNHGCYRVGHGQGVWTDIPPIASASISTSQFSFRYGRVEVYAKMPKADWMSPAILMLPVTWCYGSQWPSSGEIDLAQSISNEELKYANGNPVGIQKLDSTLHWGIDGSQNRYQLTRTSRVNQGNDYSNFHLYALEWTPDGLSYFVDDSLVLQVPPVSQNKNWNGFYAFGAPWNGANPWNHSSNPELAPFDTKFYITMNVAVGRTDGYIPDTAINRGGAYPKPWNNTDSQQAGMNKFIEAKNKWYWTWEKEGLNASMQIDYVRVYKRCDLPQEQTAACPT